GLSTPLFVLPNGIGSLKEWQDRALASSPVLAAYGAKREQAEQLVRAAKGAFLPTVSAFGQKNLVKHYLTVMEPNWIAGVSLNLTLFDNKNRRADLSAARAKLAEATSGRLEVENQLKTGVETAWLRTNEYRDQYQLTSSTVRLAEENLRMRESAFANGLSTANEVWDARTKLTGAQIEQKVAAYRFVVAWSELNAATGSMKPFIDSLSEPGRITVR
ncbi:MAG: TolC family protein, partial [Sutterellaceae bacterium]|nr:TolC family protein [Sutterellaceae bacterium]